MKSDKKVRITVTIPKKEGEKLRSFPYFASFMVSCLLEEFFKRVDIANMLQEINTVGNAEDKIVKLKGYITEAFSGANRKEGRLGVDKNADYWERWQMPGGGNDA